MLVRQHSFPEILSRLSLKPELYKITINVNLLLKKTVAFPFVLMYYLTSRNCIVHKHHHDILVGQKSLVEGAQVSD